MKTNILITTTNTIENASIENYLGVITTNVVIGANFFSDFSASFTDFFGGFSNTYQTKLQKIYESAVDDLKHKALNTGANAVIGLHIDFDEISGKGKSMFMVSVSGTAVKITVASNMLNAKSNSQGIGCEELQNEITKRHIIDLLNSDHLPTAEQWGYLLSNNSKEITNLLLINHLKYWDYSEDALYENAKLLNNNISNYFRLMNSYEAIDVLYSIINENATPIIKIIESNKLFSPLKIIQLIDNNHIREAVLCLTTDKEYYTNDNLIQMSTILNRLDNLPNVGKIEMSKGLLSKAKEKYICPDGHSNDIENEFCDYCGLNIKGLTIQENNNITNFRIKVDSLKSILNL